jgi:HAD superfamily hydrolase (TIGR01509 family)
LSAKIKAAIFDIDGVIVDSMKLLSDMPAAFLREKGITPRPDLGEQMFHRTNEMGAVYMVKTYGLSIDPKILAKELIAYQAEQYIRQVEAKPYAKETLQYLKSHNIPLLIASSNERPMIEGALSRLELLHYFEGIITSPEVGSSKENPDIFEQAIQLLGHPKKNTVLFEDGLHAITTATHIGLPVIGVYDATSASDQPEIRALADQYVLSLEEWLESDAAVNLTVP